MSAHFKLKNANSFPVDKLSTEEKRDFFDIGKKYDKQRYDAEQLYKDEKKDRIKIAKHGIENKMNAAKLVLKPPGTRSVKMSERQIENRAERNVIFQHSQTMDRITQQESSEKDTFLKTSSASKEFKEQFNQKAQRRRIEERRQNPERRSQARQKMSD